MTNDTRNYLHIRTRHPHGFRSGEWAYIDEVVGFWFPPVNHVDHITPGGVRPVFKVRFMDGTTDEWPIYDEGADYEFRLGQKVVEW